MTRFLSPFLLVLFVPVFAFAIGEGSRIDMGVSPIRDEFSVSTGTTTTRTVTFFNNSTGSYSIYLSVEDCTADNGVPKCNPTTGSGTQPNSLASWISFQGATSFTVPARTEKKVTYVVNTPANAIPGGHYGAIFFNNGDTATGGASVIKMIKRVGILLLVNASGQVVYNTSLGNIEAITGGGGGSAEGSSNIYPQRPLSEIISMTPLTFSSAPQVMENVWNYWLVPEVKDIFRDPRKVPPIDESPFSLDFQIPISNSGTIHILPVGRVELYDENGMLLKNVGKETIKTPEGITLGEKIVDYLPINDEGGNVLPGTSRVYKVSWKGFAYQGVDDGKMAIKFLSPNQYNRSLLEQDNEYLMPWEKLNVVNYREHIHAKFHVEYRGKDGELVPYDFEKEVPVSYAYVKKELNIPLIALTVLLLAGSILLFSSGTFRAFTTRGKISYDTFPLGNEVENQVELEKGIQMAKDAMERKKKPRISSSASSGEKRTSSQKKKKSEES